MAEKTAAVRIGAETFELIQAYAKAKGLNLREALEGLALGGLRRQAALKKWYKKSKKAKAIASAPKAKKRVKKVVAKTKSSKKRAKRVVKPVSPAAIPQQLDLKLNGASETVEVVPADSVKTTPEAV